MSVFMYRCSSCSFEWKEIKDGYYPTASCKKCKSLAVDKETSEIVGDSNLQHNNAEWNRSFDRDNMRREMVQPLDKKGKFNDDFMKAYGYNPFKEKSPKVKQLEAEAKLPKQRVSDKELEQREQINNEMVRQVEESIKLKPLPKRKKK